MSVFKNLVESGDKRIREEIGDFYFISKNRMEELIRNFDLQVVRIKELTKIIEEQQSQIRELQKNIIEED
jgi:hypothetical protein